MKILFLFSMLLVSLFANDEIIVKYGVVEESAVKIAIFAISAFFIFANYLVLVMVKKYKLSFLSSYALAVVKRVENESKTIAINTIHDKYKKLYHDNPKYAKALTIIEDDYSGVISSLVGKMLGVFDSKLKTLVESSLYDIEK